LRPFVAKDDALDEALFFFRRFEPNVREDMDQEALKRLMNMLLSVDSVDDFDVSSKTPFSRGIHLPSIPTQINLLVLLLSVTQSDLSWERHVSIKLNCFIAYFNTHFVFCNVEIRALKNCINSKRGSDMYTRAMDLERQLEDVRKYIATRVEEARAMLDKDTSLTGSQKSNIEKLFTTGNNPFEPPCRNKKQASFAVDC